MEETKIGVEPFATENRQLAFALLTAGCELLPREEGGPAVNVYTVGVLRQRKVGTGKTLEAAALEAHQREIPGHVKYLFLRNELLERCVKKWDWTVNAIRMAREEGVDPVLDDIKEEHIIQTMCVAANNQKAFAKIAFIRRPLCSDIDAKVEETEVPGKPGRKTTITGKGRIWTAGCSKAIREKLNL